jgi:hypothetical protein
MSLTLLILGIMTAAAGVATIGFGIPINEFSLGTTLIIAGTTALTGGLILIGLSAVVGVLGQVAEGLRTRVVPRPAPRSAEVPEPAALVTAAPPAALRVRSGQADVAVAPRPRTEATVSRPAEPGQATALEVSTAGIERLRSSLARGERRGEPPSVVAEGEEVPLSPNGTAHQPAQAASDPSPGRPTPNVMGEDRPGIGAVEALKASRLDFLFRSKPARPVAQSANVDSFWPADAGRSGSANVATQQRNDQAERTDSAALTQERVAEPPSPEQAGAPAILKSGIVDGMAYTLYADGSIEARLPQGTTRFGSIAELRAHIETNS